MKSEKSPGFFQRFWEMARHTNTIFFAPITPLYVKTALALGLLYCLSPWDFIPEWVPVLGVMDDLALAALLITWANRMALPGTPPGGKSANRREPHDRQNQ